MTDTTGLKPATRDRASIPEAMTWDLSDIFADWKEWEAALVELEKLMEDIAAATGGVHVGPVVTSGLFYDPDPGTFGRWKRLGHIGVEMEAAGIYAIAAEHGVKALALCTVSDDIPGGGALSPEERQTTFDEMIEIALETAIAGVAP